MQHTVTYNHQSQFIEMFGCGQCAYLPLREVCIRYGEYGSNTPSIPFKEGNPRYIRITDLNYDGTLNNDKVCAKEFDNKYLLSKGDFLFARTGATVGKTYCHRDGDALYAGYLIRYVTNPDKLLPEFLSIYAKTQSFWSWIHGQMKMGAQPNISSKQYNELPVPVPSIEEQTSFLSIVRQSDKSKFDGFKSQFIEMFGKYASTTRLEDLSETIIAGGDKPKDCTTDRTESNVYPVIANGIENDGIIGYSSSYRINSPSLTISARGTIGVTAIRSGMYTPIIRLIVIKPLRNINLTYLKYQLDYNGFQPTGAVQGQLTVPNVKNKMIPVPPLSEQEEFAAIVRQADKSKYCVQNKLNYICHILTNQIQLRRCS